VQTEHLQAFVTGAPGGDAGLPGVYLFASRLLTGESHPYDRGSGTLAQVVPKRPSRPRKGGWGAWEIGARYSFLDLTDEGVEGGTMNLLTLGTNWYWNRYVRWQFNYIFSGVDEGVADGRLHVLQGRFQISF
jgi:phosphate-selective porin OprO/OprP